MCSSIHSLALTGLIFQPEEQVATNSMRLDPFPCMEFSKAWRNAFLAFLMTEELKRRSDDTFRLKAGSLYPLLHGLEEKGFVSAYEREATAGKPRRYYHLTQEGHRALHEKEEAWNVYARAVGQVLKGGACCAGA